MRRVTVSAIVFATGIAGGSSAILNCGAANPEGDGFPGGPDGSVAAADGSTGVILPDGGTLYGGDGNTPKLGNPDAPTKPVSHPEGGTCEGYQCQVPVCPHDGGTTISGTIKDPAGANPLYNVMAFVPLYDPSSPQSTIQPITGGVTFPSGVTCDSCGYLYTGNPIAIGQSGTDGTFTITNAPAGTNIPVVVQVGKWRTHITVPTVTACTDNAAGSINLPSQGNPSDPVISIPQIAVSTGGSDSLECLLLRVGLNASEYVSGPGGTGHVHLYTGGDSSGTGSGGSSEPTATAPASSTNLWNSVANLQQYDITLLSCEGGETYNAVPQNLHDYVNSGGRAFASHYHYAWFTKPTESGQSYSPPSDWSNLATWQAGSNSTASGDVGGAIVTTLNTGGGTFQKGVDLQAWLKGVNALGTAMPPASGLGTPGTNGANDLAIGQVRWNAGVTSANTNSQPWVTVDTATEGSGTGGQAPGAYTTSYFSFNTPVTAVAPPDGGAPPYCGRVVFSDLHVGGGAGTNDSVDTSGQAPSACSPGAGQLSPQEKALEFMLFDLSACVTPDKAPPWTPPPPYEAGVPQ